MKFKNGLVGHGLGLLKYFKPCSKNFCDYHFFDLGGSLSNKTVNRNAIKEASNEVTTVIADSLLHSSFSPMMHGYPATLINMKSTDTTVCFKPFYHCKGVSPHNPTKHGATHAYYHKLLTHVSIIAFLKIY